MPHCQMLGLVTASNLGGFHDEVHEVETCFRCKHQLTDEDMVATFGQVTRPGKTTFNIIGGLLCCHCVQAFQEWLK